MQSFRTTGSGMIILVLYFYKDDGWTQRFVGDGVLMCKTCYVLRIVAFCKEVNVKLSIYHAVKKSFKFLSENSTFVIFRGLDLSTDCY